MDAATDSCYNLGVLVTSSADADKLTQEYVNGIVNTWFTVQEEKGNLSATSLKICVSAAKKRLVEDGYALVARHWHATDASKEGRKIQCDKTAAMRACGKFKLPFSTMASIVRWSRALVLNDKPGPVDFADLCIALLIVSGLRIGEILQYITSIQPIDPDPQFKFPQVRVGGLCKGGNHKDKDATVDVPLLVDAKVFASKLLLLRQEWRSPVRPDKKATAVNTRLKSLDIMKEWRDGYSQHFAPVQQLFPEARIYVTVHKIRQLHTAAMMRICKAEHGAVDARRFLHHVARPSAHDFYDHTAITDDNDTDMGVGDVDPAFIDEVFGRETEDVIVDENISANVNAKRTMVAASLDSDSDSEPPRRRQKTKLTSDESDDSDDTIPIDPVDPMPSPTIHIDRDTDYERRLSTLGDLMTRGFISKAHYEHHLNRILGEI